MQEKIQNIRKRCGMSQSEFAKEFSLPLRTLQQWEQGKSSPPDYVFAMLAKEAATRYGSKNRRRGGRHYIAPRRSWKICIDDPFENCERIYPIQQRKVRALVDDISANPDVGEIWIFGSSTTDKCHIGSDVDVYVQWRAHCKSDHAFPQLPAYDFEYDLWTDQMVDMRLKEEILKKGVKVYG